MSDLERKERKALRVCKEYDADHPAWKAVDQVDEEADSIQIKLKDLERAESSPQKRDASIVNTFLSWVDGAKKKKPRAIEPEYQTPPTSSVMTNHASSSSTSRRTGVSSLTGIMTAVSDDVADEN